MDFLRTHKFEILVGIGIVILFFLIRLVNLTIIPVFADEAIYIRWAQIMRDEPTLRFLPQSDGKQPLFMWATIPALKFSPDPLFAGRITSVLSGFGTLIGIALLAWYFFRSVRVSLFASFLYALSPFAVFFDRMALIDSMLAMFGVWTLFFASITARRLSLDTAMLTGFALGGGLLTKSPAIFYALMLPATAILSHFIKKVNGRLQVSLSQAVLFSGLLIVPYLIGIVMYNILRLGPNFNMLSDRAQDFIFPLNHALTNPKDPFVFNIQRVINWLWVLGPHVLLGFAAIASFLHLKRYWKEIAILWLWIILPLLIQSEYAKIYTARYIFFVIPVLIVLASSVFLVRQTLIKWILGFLLGIFVVYAGFFDYRLLTKPQTAPLPLDEHSGYFEEWTAGTGIREVSEFIRQELRKEPNHKIVVGTEGFFGTLPDGLQMYLNRVPNLDVIGVGLGINYVHPSLQKAKSVGDKTYLVVNRSRFEGDPEALGLRLIEAYPKAKRTEIHNYVRFGPQDFLLLFEVTEASIKKPEEKKL